VETHQSCPARAPSKLDAAQLWSRSSRAGFAWFAFPSDPAFQGNYACERGHVTVRLCPSTAGVLISPCVHPAQCSAGVQAQLCLGGTLADSTCTIFWDVMLFEERN